GERLFFADLAQAVHQQRTLDLLADLVLEAALDELARSAADAEAGDRSGRHQLAISLVEVAIDILARDCHGDVTLAGAGAGDLNVEVQPLGRFLFPAFSHGDVVYLRTFNVFGTHAPATR